MQVFRSALLRFDSLGQALYDEDGLLAIAPDANGVERVVAAGSWDALAGEYAQNRHYLHMHDRIIAPGFVDLHIHYPQTDVIGSPADGLLACTFL